MLPRCQLWAGRVSAAHRTQGSWRVAAGETGLTFLWREARCLHGQRSPEGAEQGGRLAPEALAYEEAAVTQPGGGGVMDRAESQKWTRTSTGNRQRAKAAQRRKDSFSSKGSGVAGPPHTAISVDTDLAPSPSSGEAGHRPKCKRRTESARLGHRRSLDGLGLGGDFRYNIKRVIHERKLSKLGFIRIKKSDLWETPSRGRGRVEWAPRLAGAPRPQLRRVS